MVPSQFGITYGAGLDQWRHGGLCAPANVSSALEWDESDALMLRASFDGVSLPSQPSKRWRRAQTAEAAFWKSWRQNTLYAHISLEAFWAEVLEKTGGPLPQGRILDIGCGPVSVLNFHRSDGVLAMGLDPLAEVYARANLIEAAEHLQPIPIVGLPAEALPFVDASLDHLICFNVLDHVANAQAVLNEMIRVLKPGGSARLYVHTFQSWIKRLLFFDRPHVYHWDHHEFQNLLTQAGFSIDHALCEPKAFDLPRGLWSRLKHFPYWVATKVSYTSYFHVTTPAISD